MDLMVEVSPRRVFANAHTYHVNSISVNSDYETYMSADDLRINLWHLDITDRSFSILLETRRARPRLPGIPMGLPSMAPSRSLRAQQSHAQITNPFLLILIVKMPCVGAGNIIPEERKCGS